MAVRAGELTSVNGAAGTRANRLDALRAILRDNPGEWFYVRRVSTRTGAESLKINLCSDGDGQFRTLSRKCPEGGYRIYAEWDSTKEKTE